MARRNGFKLALVGLSLGLIVGILIIALEKYLEGVIQSELNDMVKRSCNCEFKSDRLTVSLLRLRAFAKNARIESAGETRLLFKNISLRLGISRIASKVIDLEDITLSSGYARGIGSSSPTFKFIDFLTEPLPADRDHADRWRVKLRQLKIRNMRFVEQFSQTELRGNGLNLDLIRNSSDDFVMVPTIDSLRLRVFNSGTSNSSKWRDIKLGRLSSTITFRDEEIVFSKLLLLLNRSMLQIDSVMSRPNGDALTGSIHLEQVLNSYNLEPDYQGSFIGKGSVLGTIDNPIFKFDLNLAPNSSLNYAPANFPIFDFDNFSGGAQFDYNKGDPYFALNSGTASGPDELQLNIAQPLVMTGDNISGSIAINAASLSLPYALLELNNLRSTLSFSGSPSQPKINYLATTTGGWLGPIVLPTSDIAMEFKEDIIDFTVADKESSLDVQGRVDFKSDVPNIEKLTIDAKMLPLQITHKLSNDKAAKVTFKGNLDGPVDLSSLKGQGELTLSASQLAGDASVSGSAQLGDGVLRIKLNNLEKSLGAEGIWKFNGATSSDIKLNLNDFEPGRYDPTLECIKIDALIDLHGSTLSNAFESGQVTLNKLEFGCEPYLVRLTESFRTQIRNGSLTLSPPINLSGTNSDIKLSGSLSTISGPDLTASGVVELSSLLPYLPAVDDIRGQVDGKLRLDGTWETPQLSGTAQISNGDFAIEQANLSGDEFSGELNLNSGSITIKKFEGKINGGKIKIQGTIVPLEPAKSNLNLLLDRIEISPLPNVFLVASADLKLGADLNQTPVIIGEIDILQGELSKKIDLASILSQITIALFVSDSPSLVGNYLATTAMGATALDVSVRGSRNLFVLTSFAAAELRAALAIRGTLANPNIRGEMETLNGWFGLKERRFNITSGKLILIPELNEPQIEITAESNIRTPEGDALFVILEANGDISNPKIHLYSDQGVPENELITLVTSSGTYSKDYFASSLSLRKYDPNPQAGFNPFDTIRRTFSSLTDLENYSIEPSYNSITGVIEPKLIAKTALSDRLNLVGESSVGASSSESKIKLEYDLTSRLKLIGIADSSSAQDQTSYGSDLVVTLLSSQEKFTNIHFEGVRELDERSILRGLRLDSNSRILRDDISRISNDIEKFYQKNGFLTASASGICADQTKFCRNLSFNVSEGPLFTIADIDIDWNLLTPIGGRSFRLGIKSGDAALLTVKDRTIERIVTALRSEGFISARVKSEFLPIPETSKANLDFTIELGRPVSFIFKGNTVFSSKELLESIDLFQRKQPFGPNTIHILVENIESLYRSRGYLFATIQATTTSESSDERTTYLIKIEEGPIVAVDKVSFEGANSISFSKWQEIISAKDPELAKEFFNPNFAIAEQLEYLTLLLKRLYDERGFSDASVEYKIVEGPKNNSVDIVYSINEGDGIVYSKIELKNCGNTQSDLSVQLPKIPSAPISTQRVNSFIDSTANTLRDIGYRFAKISTQLSEDKKILTVTCDVGERTKIGKIEVIGNSEVSESVIRERGNIHEGDFWNNKLIQHARGRLLRTGLFSRVEIIASDGTIDSNVENITIRVFEKPLRTLELGGGYDSESGVHLLADFADRRYFGDGRIIGFRSDIYFNSTGLEVTRGVAGLRYADPNLFEEFKLSEDLRFQRIENSNYEFDLDRVSFASYVNRNWGGRTQLNFGHTILTEQLDNVAEDSIIGDFDSGNVNLSFISAAVTFDGRDFVLNPEQGVKLSLEGKFASSAIGSEADYLENSARLSFLTPIPRFNRFGIANQSRIGAAWGFAGTDQIPISQRFYLGGQNTVRGFAENSLGPRGDQGHVIGGDLLFQNNFEFRYLIADGFSTHTFFDVGTVYLRDRSFSFDDLRRSVGVGVRYLSPIGPIGFDIGHPLDARDDESSFRLHFSIGTMF